MPLSSVRGIKQFCDPAIYLSHAPSQQRCILGLWLLQNTNRKPADQRGCTGSIPHGTTIDRQAVAPSIWPRRFAVGGGEGTYRFAARYVATLLELELCISVNERHPTVFLYCYSSQSPLPSRPIRSLLYKPSFTLSCPFASFNPFSLCRAPFSSYSRTCFSIFSIFSPSGNVH